nr:deaminase [Wolbachia endosymbiont of Diaphorina citri]
MELAIEQAKLAQKDGEVPIGAVIVNGNNIISSAHNISNDPTAHAEMLTIRQAFSTSTLYEAEIVRNVRAVPDVRSSYLFAKIKRLYFGAYNPKGGGVENGTAVFNSSTFGIVSPEVQTFNFCKRDSLSAHRARL